MKPWQRYNPYSETYNYEAEKDDPHSIVNYFKKVNQLREGNQILIDGKIDFLDTDDKILNYVRVLNHEGYMVILNLTDKKVKYPYGFERIEKEHVLANYDDEAKFLRPYEARVYKINKKEEK